MIKNYYGFLLSLMFFVSFSLTASSQTTITQWNFDASNLTASTGTGTATLVGGTTTTYAQGNPTSGMAANTAGYPAQGTNSGTAGIQFNVSTVGYTNIIVSWDNRFSGTAANRTRVKYTLDGTNWLNFEATDDNATNLYGSTPAGFDAGRYNNTSATSPPWFIRTANFSAISGANNNPNFAVRFVSEFADGTSYFPVTSSSTYGTGGTMRYDNVTFAGTTSSGTPALVANPSTLSNFTYAVGTGPSASQSYTLTGSSLTPAAGNITVTPSTNYEISLNNTTFSSTALTVPYTGGELAATPVYVRLKAGLAAGAYNGEVISNAGGGATTVNVTVNGTVSNPATQLAFLNFPATGLLNQTIATFKVQALNANSLVDPGYTGAITLSKVSGPGNLAGTLTQNAVAGEATFNDISFTAAGSYVLQATATGLASATSSTIVISLPPTITADILPQYMSGRTPANTRTPVAFRATIQNLTPNATYRYLNSAVISTDGPTAGGAGVLLFVNSDGTFTRSTLGNMANAGEYGEFTTNSSGSYSGWFMLEPSTNDRFTAGNEVFMRIRLNNGAGGTTAVTYLTISESIKVLQFSPESSAISGSAVRATSLATPKNFSLLYDNMAGTGRPLFVTSIETTGIDFTAVTSYAPFYRNDVSGKNGAWGGIIPNVNPEGVKLIEERSLTTGAIVKQETSADGIWGFTDTRNPVNGIDSVLVIHLTPEILIETVPAFIQGNNGTNNKRVPMSFYATITYLKPNATYRYYNKAVLEADASTTDGAGNTIFVKSDGTFVRTASSSMNTAGQYGEFTADNMGNYSGWFMLEPTSDNRFTPGNNLRMRIMLNNGENGTSVAVRLTTTATAQVINFGTGYTSTNGTGIRGVSTASSGNMVYIYGNETGSGQPLYASSIENTGMNFASFGNYATFFVNDVAGNQGSWGGIVPNVLPDGVRRIEERSRTTGNIVNVWTSTDGVWGLVDTRNPLGGDGTILLIDLMPTGEPTLTVIPSVLTGFTYMESNGPSASQTYTISGTDLEGTGNITITAPQDYEVSVNNTNFYHMAELPFADGIITNQPVTIYVRLKAGLPMGLYNNQIITNTGGGAPDKTVTVSGEVTTSAIPGISSVMLPMFIEGLNGTNTNRLPFAYRATLSYLQPNATYRYYNKVVLATDAPDFNGAGNTIFAHADGTFTRTTATSLDTQGQYGEFTTDSNGSYSGWFITEPSGNDRFTPGNQLYMRINLNDGNGGTVVANRYTTTQYARVLQFGTESLPTRGTAVSADSYDAPGDFVFLFEGASDTIRPLYGTNIETTQIDYCATNVYAPFYCDSIAGVDGSWGAIIPNVNPNGVQVIKVYANEDGALKKTYTETSAIWAGTDTRNPAGGTDIILYLDMRIVSVVNISTLPARIWSSGNTINIEPDFAGAYDLSIYSMSGAKMLSRNFNGNSRIQLNLPAGVYVAQLRNNNGSYSVKVVIK